MTWQNVYGYLFLDFPDVFRKSFDFIEVRLVCLQNVYAGILSNLPDLVTTLLKQFESLFSATDLNASKRGPECTAEVSARL